MKTYIINTKKDFDDYFHYLKKDALIESIPNIFCIGFDIEFIQKIHHPKSFEKANLWVDNLENGIATCIIQVASENICLVINVSKMLKPLPKKLIKLIKNDCWVKLGIGVERDLEILSQNYNLGHCGGGIELKNICLMAKYSKPSLENLYQKFIGPFIKKNHSICDWSKDILTQEELTYAARDAFMSYQLGIILNPSIESLKEKRELDVENTKLKIDFINESFEIKEKDEEYAKAKTNAIEKEENINFIGKLFELSQKKGKENQLCFEEEQLAEQEFRIFCLFENERTFGIASNKKKAKQMAAEKMYYLINKI